MGFQANKKKIAVASLASILLVAMVAAVAVGITKRNSGDHDSGNGGKTITSGTTKAVKAICSPTDFKETCEKSLSGANTTNPTELIKLAFEAGIKNIQDAVKSSSLFKQASTDEATKGALQVCEEVLDTSIEDLRRSFDKVGDFDVSKLDDYVADVKTWLSAVVTYQETCLDAFENTTGDTGAKMKKVLQTASELTSNGLAMVNDFSTILSSLGIGSFGSRRLLSNEERILYAADPTDYAPGEEPHSGFYHARHPKKGKRPSPPSFVDEKARKLMSASPASLKPNAVVAQDGSGQFKTISAALSTLPKKSNQTFVIFVKAGVYKETVIIPRHVNNIALIGEGPLKTRISGSKNFADGTQTFHTATVAVNSDGFFAKDIGFENTAGSAKHQAVALRVSGDKAIFYNVHIDGFQDTLYAHNYRQYYRDCVISGTIDFIFGDAEAVFQKCRLVVRKPLDNQECMVTAQGRKDRRSVGVTVIQNCDIVAEPAFTATKPPLRAYLGRPWKEFSRTIIMQSNIEAFIAPEGWKPWQGTFALDTLYYGEYQNRGPGSNQSQRVKWKGIQKITPQIAESFTAGKLFTGDDLWVKSAGIPYTAGMMQV